MGCRDTDQAALDLLAIVCDTHMQADVPYE